MRCGCNRVFRMFRFFVYSSAGLFLALLLACCNGTGARPISSDVDAGQSGRSPAGTASVSLFLAGDVMTGRGIDQILPHPGDPWLYEPFMRSAAGYVELAERASGAIPTRVNYAYIWGDALAELAQVRPDVRLINLETSVTTSDDNWPDKGIHYRMHPDNIPALTTAGIDYASLANNHVLDWGYAGLTETLETLEGAQIQYAGAGRDLRQAEAPAVLEAAGKGRVVVFSYGLPTSGIPPAWAAAEDRPGVNLLSDLSDQAVRRIAEQVEAIRQPGDIFVVSIHWGGNWGYEIPAAQIDFAHKLIEKAGVDVIHGHSSHHVKGIEVYRDRPILYGAGDFLNDYEGIGGQEQFRPDLTLMYFVEMDPTSGKLVQLRMTPMQIKQFRLNRASRSDAAWLSNVLSREGEALGTRAELSSDNTLRLSWN